MVKAQGHLSVDLQPDRKFSTGERCPLLTNGFNNLMDITCRALRGDHYRPLKTGGVLVCKRSCLDLPGKSGERQLRNPKVFYGEREQANAGVSA